jgi:8-oxo-dGTP diphosphatase
LQLRDDKPGVTGRGLWGLFGGAVHEGEAPREALVREVDEELTIRIAEPQLLWSIDGTSELSPAPKRWWFFEVDATEQWGDHVLCEGQAAELFWFEDIVRLPMARITREVLTRHHAGVPRHGR